MNWNPGITNLQNYIDIIVALATLVDLLRFTHPLPNLRSVATGLPKYKIHMYLINSRDLLFWVY